MFSLWTDGIVPYHISYDIDDRQVSRFYERVIEAAIDEFHRYTCVRFLQFDKRKANVVDFGQIANYVNFIITTDSLCDTKIGFIGGRQDLVLSEGCTFYPSVLHYMMKTIGFTDEIGNVFVKSIFCSKLPSINILVACTSTP
jgi:hypothetical protein